MLTNNQWAQFAQLNEKATEFDAEVLLGIDRNGQVKYACSTFGTIIAETEVGGTIFIAAMGLGECSIGLQDKIDRLIDALNAITF